MLIIHNERIAALALPAQVAFPLSVPERRDQHLLASIDPPGPLKKVPPAFDDSRILWSAHALKIQPCGLTKGSLGITTANTARKLIVK